MAALGLHDVTIAFAGPPLLDGVAFALEDGERVGLVGRNGAGKSTLLRLFDGTLAPDSGTVSRRPGLRVAALQQEVPIDLHGPVSRYLHEVCGVHAHETPWEVEARIDRTAHDLGLDLAAPIEALSAGSKRRVLLAAALVRDPDVLLLDEPTNHLDVEAIQHLEETLCRRAAALVFVTHDRAFLQNVATRIVDLDRGALRSYPTTYDEYLRRRDDELRVEAEQAALFDKKLAQEEAWLRQGIKARRTRNEGRVRALEAMRDERRARRDPGATVKATLQDAEKSGRLVLRVRDVDFGYGDAPVVRGLSTTIMRGDRIGIVGPNGCGKTTVLGLLLGRLSPQGGTVEHGTRLEVAHAAQLPDSFDDARSVVDCLADGREFISVGGAQRHVVGYLRDFLFTGEQIQGPVGRLSGGERQRLQLARLFSRPCNLLVLDEPTNDLDLDTLELLEELLLDFDGTLLVVSHDRAFLDNVVTSTLVFEGDGRWGEYVGGYTDAVRQRRVAAPVAAAAKAARADTPAKQPKKFGFNERRELDKLPAKIEKLEAERATLWETMSAPDFYATRGDAVAATTARLAALEAEIETAYARWAELEALAGS